MDVLSDVLSTVRLHSTVFVQTELVAPWGMSARAQDHFAFHVISRGRCWLDVEGLAAVEVEAGDVVVVAPGRGHALRDAPGTPAPLIEELLAEGALCAPARPSSTIHDGPSATQIVCGSFRFEDVRGDLLLSALPAVLHIRQLLDDAGPWLAQTIRLLAYESLANRPGTATLVNRLCDALFIYVLRSHLASTSASGPNWLRALVEPGVGTALQLIHDDPALPWTVATLAAKVGMSRSAFSDRFTRAVGQTPIRYLTGWRLHKAAAILRAEGADLTEVARRTGYDSAAAFSKAFKRSVGVAPGAYRRAAVPDRAGHGDREAVAR